MTFQPPAMSDYVEKFLFCWVSQAVCANWAFRENRAT